jgi:hypothetical protein
VTGLFFFFFFFFAGKPDYRHLTTLSFHYYKFKEGGPNVGNIEQSYKDHKRDGRRLGSGLMMTEFYLDGEAIYDAVELADLYGISWITWAYKVSRK